MANNYEGKYQNFMFMAGWRDMLEGMEQDFGIEYAQEVLWQLMLVGTLPEQEISTSKQSITGFLEGCVLPVLKTSTANYNKNKQNGSKGGRPKIEIDVAEAIRLHDEEHMNWKAVAKHMGVSEDTLRQARREAEKPKNPEIKPEKLDEEKSEKPKNPPVNPTDDNSGRKTEKPKNDLEIAGFRF